MAAVNNLVLLLIITNFFCIAFAFDPTPSQDFCVADLNSPLRISGPWPCKNSMTVTADDFYHYGLDKPGNISNGVALTRVGVNVVPGLNTLGLSMARLDLAPGGLFPLHYHPRASELHIVLQGKLEVGFISPEQNYKYYNKTLNKGDMFVVPPGLVHVQRNAFNGYTSSYAIVNSQNPGIDIITQAVFGAKPAIDTRYLAQVYQLDDQTIKKLQGMSWGA
ncbi:germin-like protein 1 PjGLP1 [Phtheirospermum japonicum]|uniref:Germin-like protein n=1 Tax=Phtheirospermum japonicum TaxID=374723 RepID=A0A830C0D5_9LAMI|nr:germin-like protein [Phtheirospermum japonicum]GFP91602.1 germin-like protein 1 PjGLP1 [Phtheirospermum japonicum]